MTEYAILTVYVFIIGTQVGRALTLRQQALKTVEGITCLLNHEWIGPQVLAARIHGDQEVTGELPAMRLAVLPQAPKMPIWLELQYEFSRWRVPRIRRGR